jgi:hypothetical protein
LKAFIGKVKSAQIPCLRIGDNKRCRLIEFTSAKGNGFAKRPEEFPEKPNANQGGNRLADCVHADDNKVNSLLR